MPGVLCGIDAVALKAPFFMSFQLAYGDSNKLLSPVSGAGRNSLPFKGRIGVGMWAAGGRQSVGGYLLAIAIHHQNS